MAIKIQTIKDIRIYLASELEGSYPVGEIRAISNIIITTLLGLKSLNQVYLADQKIDNGHVREIIRICTELKRGKPLQYILGETVFYDCRIKLSSATLIPRQETEELADLIIKENAGFDRKIIDMGTGSGCIAIAIAVNLPLASVTGTDISVDALAIASENARLNGVNTEFLMDDILNPASVFSGKAGIIVSNPPYVRKSESTLMNSNVLDYEPHTALFVDDSDPLVFYRAILKKAESMLEPGGKIYFEINEALGREMYELLESFHYGSIKIIKDINGKDRITKGIRHAG